MTGKYYLYRHIRLDTSQPFYVGIGTKKHPNCNTIRQEYARAYHKNNRNESWFDITTKYPYEIEIMSESNDYKQILDKEKEFIELYGRLDLGTGTLCNLTTGGQGHELSQEAKLKITNSLIGNKRAFGFKHTEQVKIKMSEDRKGKHAGEKHPNFGKKQSEETRLKKSLKLSGIKNPMYGKNHTEKTKQLQSAAKKGKPLTEQHKLNIKNNNSKYWSGKKHSKETIEKMSKAGKIKIFSETHRKNIGIRSIGNKHALGHKCTLEVNKSKGRSGSLNNQSKKVTDEKTGLSYPSIKFCAEKFGINYSTLKSMLNGTIFNTTTLKLL